jgi:hypothetical protein
MGAMLTPFARMTQTRGLYKYADEYEVLLHSDYGILLISLAKVHLAFVASRLSRFSTKCLWTRTICPGYKRWKFRESI